MMIRMTTLKLVTEQNQRSLRQEERRLQQLKPESSGPLILDGIAPPYLRLVSRLTLEEARAQAWLDRKQKPPSS
jgi:hypothetical protein